MECKVGSSEGGREPSEDSHHPERVGVVRSFRPVGHRHTAEAEQELTLGGAKPRVDLSVTAVELVRGVLATAHVYVNRAVEEKDLWKIYRERYASEPFVRIVKERTGIFRYPEPKLLAGTNFADVGFALDPRGDRVVALCAIDNLVKGAAGNGVQAMNVRLAWTSARDWASSAYTPSVVDAATTRCADVAPDASIARSAAPRPVPLSARISTLPPKPPPVRRAPNTSGSFWAAVTI